MSIRSLIPVLSTVFWAAIASAQERPSDEPAYRAWLEAGVAFTPSTELHSFPGTAGGSKLNFHPGVRLGIGSGYAFTPHFALDWEIGVIANSVESAAGLQEFDAVVTQIPLLVNATFQYQNETGITPFLGVGAGGASTSINIDEARGGSASVEGTDYDFVFAWQAFGGVKYEFRKGLALGIVYKYLWSTEAKWELEDDFSGADEHLEMDGLSSHSVLAFVSYRF